MNIREFKAWLEGFEEAIEKAPTESQWKKLKEKLAQVTDAEPDLLKKFKDLEKRDYERKPKWPDYPDFIPVRKDKMFLGPKPYRAVTIS